MSIDKEITKSWIEKKIHEKAVKRYENEINQAYNQLKDSVVGELSIKNPPKYWKLNGYNGHLRSGDDSYDSLKEEVFSAMFEDYDEFKKQKIAEHEREETDVVLNSIKGISAFLDDVDNN